MNNTPLDSMVLKAVWYGVLWFLPGGVAVVLLSGFWLIGPGSLAAVLSLVFGIVHGLASVLAAARYLRGPADERRCRKAMARVGGGVYGLAAVLCWSPLLAQGPEWAEGWVMMTVTAGLSALAGARNGGKLVTQYVAR